MQTIFPTTPESEIVSTRILEVPQAKLFSAWSNPLVLKKWWGPKGFTNTFHTFDFREGGTWDFTMHGPEKGHYHNQVEFVKIDTPHSIAWKRISKPLFNVELLLRHYLKTKPNWYSEWFLILKRSVINSNLLL